MTEDELTAIVPEDQRTDFTALLTEIRTKSNPLTGITDEGFVELLKGNPDLSKIQDARIGSAISTREKSWQEETDRKQDALFKQRYAEEHPDETPEQKRIKALEIKTEESDHRAVRAEMRTKALQALTDKAMPTALLEMAIGSTAEQTTANIAAIEAAFTAFGQQITDKVLKDNGRIPDTDNKDVADKYYDAAQISAMSPQEQDQNWDKIQESMKYLESLER